MKDIRVRRVQVLLDLR